MALQKEIINNLGVKTSYHRIGSLNKRNDILEVNIVSYVDKSYREKEEEIQNTIRNLDELVVERDIYENKTNRSESEEKEYLELKNKIDNAIINANVSYTAWSNTIEINKPEIEHISFEDVYSYLKTVEPYIGALDC